MRKQQLLALFVLAALCFSSILPVGAVSGNSVEEKAYTLSQLSILSGNGTDYDLDGYLKRNQAAVFLVKALGKNAYVSVNKEQYKNTGYKDVAASAWYAPYVGYCSEQKIMEGYISGMFSPDSAMSEIQFLTSVLSALGYISGEDYGINAIYTFAFNIGLVTDESYKNKLNDNINYKRADAIEVLYNFLKTPKKGTNVTVIEGLVAEGIVSQDIAKSTSLLKNTDSVETAIVTATTIDQGKLFLELNEKIKKLSSSDISIYETSDSTKRLSVELEAHTDDAVVIKTSNQSAGKEYTLEISKAEDMEGNVVENIKIGFTGFRTVRTQSDFLRISQVDAINNKTINVFFTQPININAEIPTQYDIYDENGNIFVNGSFQNMSVKCLTNSKTGISISLKNAVFTGSKKYELRVSGSFTGLYGTEMNEGMEDRISFFANAKEDIGSSENELDITSVSALDSKALEVLFNKEIDPFYAKQFLNYVVTGSGNTSIAVNKAILIEEGDNKGMGVRLGLASPLSNSKQYELYVNFITDINRRHQLSERKFAFSGDYPVKSDLIITNVEATNKRTVTAVFDKPLDASTVMNTSYYTIIGLSQYGYSCNPTKVSYESASGYYIVKLFLPADKPLQYDKTYKLRVSRSLQYNFGNTSSKDIESSFGGSSDDLQKPNIIEALIIGKDTIKLAFDIEIAEEVPNLSPYNYNVMFDVEGTTATKVPTSVIYIDPMTLVLKFDHLDFDTSYKIRFNTIKDLAGVNPRTALDGQNSIDVKLGKR